MHIQPRGRFSVTAGGELAKVAISSCLRVYLWQCGAAVSQLPAFGTKTTGETHPSASFDSCLSDRGGGARICIFSSAYPHSSFLRPTIIRQQANKMIPAQMFAKRGLEMVQALSTKRQSDKPNDHQIPPLAALIFVLTCLAFFILLAAISYTYGHLITTLCMVESSSSNAYVPIGSVEPAEDAPPAYTEDGIPKPDDAEVNLVRTQPITASLRTTILHLRARGGFWSRFRGLSVYIVWNFARSFVTGMLSAASSNPFAMVIASIIGEVLLVRKNSSFPPSRLTNNICRQISI